MHQGTNDTEDKKVQRIGIGGYKCPCCAPAPKHRAKLRRAKRRVLRQKWRAELKTTLQDLAEAANVEIQ